MQIRVSSSAPRRSAAAGAPAVFRCTSSKRSLSKALDSMVPVVGANLEALTVRGAAMDLRVTHSLASVL